MQLKALDSNVRIRSNLNFENHCYRELIVTDTMLELFNRKQIYVTNEVDGKEIDDFVQRIISYPLMTLSELIFYYIDLIFESLFCYNVKLTLICRIF